MNTKYAVKIGNGDSYIALASVYLMADRLCARVMFEPDTPEHLYALIDSSGTPISFVNGLGKGLHVGSPVLVRFTMEDQFAQVVTMDELASKLGRKTQ